MEIKEYMEKFNYRYWKVYTAKDRRQRLVYVDEDGKHRSKSFPRILMEMKLGKPLDPEDDVHHLDYNPTNNNLDNLDVVNHIQHCREHSQKYFDMEFICPICGRKFIMSAKKYRQYVFDLKNRPWKRNSVPACSRRCSYYLGVQERANSNVSAGCGLNGEGSPNTNTVPNISI